MILSRGDLIYIVNERGLEKNGNPIPFDPACVFKRLRSSKREQQTKFRNTNKINFQGYELENPRNV